jgi:uncharacterized membrane protein YdjX (TVP38/TMEM64 family)
VFAGALGLVVAVSPAEPESLRAALLHVPPSLRGPALATAIALLVQAFVPLTALIAVAVWTIGPMQAAVWSLVGGIAGASLGWACGRFWVGRRIERIAPGAIAAMRRRLRRRTVLEIAAVRAAPVLPYALVNLAAGAARVPVGSFLAGTVLALLPGLAVVAGVVDRMAHAWRTRDPAAAAVAVAAVAALWAALRLRTWAAGRAQD